MKRTTCRNIALLRDLRRLGYNYFAAETLQKDPDLTSRGYPALGKTGYYTNEPLYADLVRSAKALGYTTVAYEYEDLAGSDGSLAAQNQRERGQAQNLYDRIFKIDPRAKVLVHAGYGHIYKTGMGEWTPMGAAFREITGINPVTVEQTEMSERGSAAIESSVYRWAEGKWRFREPVVLRGAKNEPYVPFMAGLGDMTVFSPRTQYEMQRPNWMRISGQRKPVRLQVRDLPSNTRLIAEARLASEGSDAVPLDVVEVPATTGAARLWLPKGHYTTTVKDAMGRPVRTLSQTVR